MSACFRLAQTEYKHQTEFQYHISDLASYSGGFLGIRIKEWIEGCMR